MEYKLSSKQVVSMVQILGEDILAAAKFKGLRDISFQAE